MKEVVEYQNGRVLYCENYNDKGQLHGKFELFFDNGNPWKIADYEYGRLHGRVFTYVYTGKMIRVDYYWRGRLICESTLT